MPYLYKEFLGDKTSKQQLYYTVECLCPFLVSDEVLKCQVRD